MKTNAKPEVKWWNKLHFHDGTSGDSIHLNSNVFHTHFETAAFLYEIEARMSGGKYKFGKPFNKLTIQQALALAGKNPTDIEYVTSITLDGDKDDRYKTYTLPIRLNLLWANETLLRKVEQFIKDERKRRNIIKAKHGLPGRPFVRYPWGGLELMDRKKDRELLTESEEQEIRALRRNYRAGKYD